MSRTFNLNVSNLSCLVHNMGIMILTSNCYCTYTKSERKLAYKMETLTNAVSLKSLTSILERWNQRNCLFDSILEI